MPRGGVDTEDNANCVFLAEAGTLRISMTRGSSLLLSRKCVPHVSQLRLSGACTLGLPVLLQ
jgi:hypothetical protein